MSLTVPRQRRRRRRKIEIEAERAAKRRNLMEMVAQLRESHAALESQSQAMDLTKVSTLVLFKQRLVSRDACLQVCLAGQTLDMTKLSSSPGFAAPPQGLSVTGRLFLFAGGQPVPQGPDGAAAAVPVPDAQSQRRAGHRPAHHEETAGSQEKCGGPGAAVSGQQESSSSSGGGGKSGPPPPSRHGGSPAIIACLSVPRTRRTPRSRQRRTSRGRTHPSPCPSRAEAAGLWRRRSRQRPARSWETG